MTDTTDPVAGTTMRPTAIDIILVSHTNVGKTTLVRTLLGKDVGEVLDAPDVTTASGAYDLAVNETSEALRLWDTPGFGDSFRLAKRLRQKQRWIAWIIRELWDRYRNPRLWRGQRVAMDLRARATVVMYLINAVERPVDAIYVAPELEVLAWVGKPVMALLNQSGDLTSSEGENAQVVEWRNALAKFPVVRKTLTLDSYTRCWVQELVLYDEIGNLLGEPIRTTYMKLAKSIQDGHRARFDDSIRTVSAWLLRIARDQVQVETEWLQSMKTAIQKVIPWGKNDGLQQQELAMQSLAQRFMEETKSATDRLIHINRLAGVSAGEIVAKAGEGLSIDRPIDPASSALGGGIISGALAGLGADLMTGGMSLGTGTLVGAILGAVGAGALAKGYNVYAKKGKTVIRWSPESLTQAFSKSVMLYLAIAHFGRGQGEWRRKDAPAHWGQAAGESVGRYRDRLQQLWTRAANEPDSPDLEQECATVLRYVLVEVLGRLYPEAGGQVTGLAH